MNLQEESSTLRNRSSFKKNRGYYKSKRRRRQGSQSSVDRSPATKRSPTLPCGSKTFLNDNPVSYQNGVNGTLSNDEQDFSMHNGATSPPVMIPGVGKGAPNSSDSGPHPASSCESDVENKNNLIPDTWNLNLRSYNNNTNNSKRTRSQNERCSTDSSEENSGEISDFEEEFSCNGTFNPFEMLEMEDERIRRVMEDKGRPTEHYGVRIGY